MTPLFERICVIVAMPSELQHLPGLPRLPEPDNSPWPSVSWRQGPLELTAVLCGIGMIRAAAATEASIAAHGPDAILNFGCAGAHRHDIDVGDVVIGTRSVAHSSMVVGPDDTSWFHLHDGQIAPPPGRTGIESDPTLIRVARSAAEERSRVSWQGDRIDDLRAPNVQEGTVASADVWTQSHAGIQALADRHQSLCEDMEAAAIATISEFHGVPFLSIKDISNNELLQATAFDPERGHVLEAEVGRRAALLTGRVIDALASSR